MSISVGGINLADAVIDAQYRISVLEKIVAHLVSRNPGAITGAEVQNYQEQALAEMQARYPNAGIQRK